MPDLAQVVPAFNVESIEANPEEKLRSRISRKVEFESIDFNQRFLATVPSEYDPIALRELFGPGFLDWVTTIKNEIDFGINDRQLWFLWRLRERTEAELDEALKNGGELFRRLRSEMEEHGINTYPARPVARGPRAVSRGGEGSARVVRGPRAARPGALPWYPRPWAGSA